MDPNTDERNIGELHAFSDRVRSRGCAREAGGMDHAVGAGGEPVFTKKNRVALAVLEQSSDSSNAQSELTPLRCILAEVVDDPLRGRGQASLIPDLVGGVTCHGTAETDGWMVEGRVQVAGGVGRHRSSSTRLAWTK